MGPFALVRSMVRSDVSAIEAEIETLKARAAAALTEINELEQRKLASEDRAEVERLDRELSWQRLTVTKVNKDLPKLESRLNVAKAAARDALRRKLMAPVDEAFREFFASAANTRMAFDAIVRIKHALSQNGFEEEARALTLPAHINGSPFLARDLLQRSEQELHSRMNPASKRRISQSAPSHPPKGTTGNKLRHRPLNERHLPPTVEHHAVRLEEPPPPKSSKRRPLRADTATNDDTQALVIFIRPGVELPDGTQSLPGDQVSVPAEKARSLVENGAADYVRIGSPIEPLRSTDVSITA